MDFIHNVADILHVKHTERV